MYMAATYYGQIHISKHLVHVGEDITATAVTALGGKAGWDTPPGPIVSGCKSEELSCTWKAVAGSDYPASERTSGWSGGWEVYEGGFCGFFGCAPSGDYYYVEGHHRCTADDSAAEARVPKAAAAGADCPPTLALKGAAVKVNPVTGGRLDLSAGIFTGAADIKNAEVKVTLLPSVALGQNDESGTLTAKAGNVPKASSKTTAMPADIAPTVVANGHTLGTMNEWTKDGWQGSQAKATLGGGNLVFSDSPEYVAASTRIQPTGKPGGNEIEGVLYQETGSTFAATEIRPEFRLYFNHENRTSVAKSICFVFTSTTGGTSVTQDDAGMDITTGDPVAAGRAALEAYEASRRKPSPGAVHAVVPGSGYAECPIGAELAPTKVTGYKLSHTVTETVTDPKTKKTHSKKVTKSKTVPTEPSKLGKDEKLTTIFSPPPQVVNGIIDYTAHSGNLQVGVVVIDSSRVGEFVSNPLKYHFADSTFPKGDPGRTYESGGAMVNAGESHVSGTFDYDTVKVELPEYDVNAGEPVGALLAGSPKTESEQYAPSIDTDAYDTGNYGVFYQVSVKTKGEEGEAAQVLLNPRAVGRDENLGVVNGFAGLVDVPEATGTTLGSEIAAPSRGQPGVGSTGNLTENKYGIGIGRVKAGKSFSFEFMPPGGASLPVAAVLAPAFVKVNGELTYDNGKSVSAETKIFPLQP
jgi:hypothetical protein